MNLLENIQKRIQNLENNLTLKNDYSEEIEKLNSIENDISVAKFYCNTSLTRYKLNESLKEVNRIKTWIKEEISNKD